MREDLIKIRQLAAVAAWETPLAAEILDLATGLIDQLDARPVAVIVELSPYRPAARPRAA